MFFVILLTIACGSKAQDGEVIVSNNKTECVNDMVKWCAGMQYPQQGAGMTMESITYDDPSGPGQDEVFCSSDSDGTVCKMNGDEWFSCSPNKTVTYNGQNLIANTSEGVDDDICKTTDMALNDILVQNMSFKNETLKEEVQQTLEVFFEQFSDMRDQMDRMQDQLDSVTLFLKKYVMGGVTDGFPFQGQTDMTTVYPSDDSLNTTDQINPMTDLPNNNNNLNNTDQINPTTILLNNNNNTQNNTDEINPTTFFLNDSSLNNTDQINLIILE